MLYLPLPTKNKLNKLWESMSRWEIRIVKVMFISPTAQSFSLNKEQWMWVRNVYCIRRKGTQQEGCSQWNQTCKEVVETIPLWMLKMYFSLAFSSPHSSCLPLSPLWVTSLSAFVFILCNKSQGRIVEMAMSIQGCPFLTKGDITLHIPTEFDSKGRGEEGEISLIEI